MPTWEMILKPDRGGTLAPWKVKYVRGVLSGYPDARTFSHPQEEGYTCAPRLYISSALRGMELGAAPGLGGGLEPPKNDQVPRTSEE